MHCVSHPAMPCCARASWKLRWTQICRAIDGDPVQLQQVLLNLVINAFDAMRDTPPSRRKVLIATQSNGDGTVRTSVRDYGVGISEDMRDRLFDPFFSTKTEGLGMGLAIVRSIVESHGGTITAENADGGGARFEFVLPANGHSSYMIPANSLVFLIDDDASVRKGVSRLLRSAGYKNEAFTSASDFLAREQHPGPACVIVDVRMPGLNGMDLQNVLIQRRREEQLVFITGHGDISMCAQAMKAGAVDFLPKPFRDNELLECVERALARSAEQRRRGVERAEARRLLDLLTPREFEVMQLVVTGMLNKQIAAELGTAEKTIKVHRGRVMKKLGIASVAELVRLVETARIASVK